MADVGKRTQVRMPTEVHELLIERAKRNDRSMNAELVRILKEVLTGTTERRMTFGNENAPTANG